MSYIQQLGFTVAKPTGPPTLAAGTTSGSLTPTGVYGYKCTFVSQFGETDPNTTAATFTATSTGSINLTAIPVSPTANVLSRNIYRTAAGGGTYLLAANIANNTATTFTDILADAGLGAAAPLAGNNTASSLQQFNGQVKLGLNNTVPTDTAITAGVGGSSAAAYQLTARVSVVTTVGSVNDSVKLPPASANNIGLMVTVRNNGGGNTMRIYPFNGQTINNGGADSPVTLASATTTNFVCDSATDWLSF